MVELKNQADGLFHTYETTLKDNGHLISEDLRQPAETVLRELQMLLLEPSASLENVQQLIDQLQQQIFAMGTAVYQQGTTPYSNSSSTSSSNPTDSPRHTPLSRAAAPTPPPPAAKKVASTLTLDLDDETEATDYEAVE